MKVKLKYFGMVEEVTGKPEEDFECSEDTVKGLIEVLNEKYIGLEKINIKIALNQEIAGGEEKIEEGSEIALLPPFAGG